MGEAGVHGRSRGEGIAEVYLCSLGGAAGVLTPIRFAAKSHLPIMRFNEQQVALGSKPDRHGGILVLKHGQHGQQPHFPSEVAGLE